MSAPIANVTSDIISPTSESGHSVTATMSGAAVNGGLERWDSQFTASASPSLRVAGGGPAASQGSQQPQVGEGRVGGNPGQVTRAVSAVRSVSATPGRLPEQLTVSPSPSLNAPPSQRASQPSTAPASASPQVRTATTLPCQQQQGPPMPPKPVGIPDVHPSGFKKIYDNLIKLVEESEESVVRHVVRDQWHKCLVGSDYHSSFIANATFYQTPPAVLQQSIKDYGEKLVKSSKHEIMTHLTSEDFDSIADDIIPKLSPQFMDQVITRRLQTIPAQDLVNLLARSERLGYDIHDVVDGPDGTRMEHVIPSMHNAMAMHPPPQGPAPYQAAPPRPGHLPTQPMYYPPHPASQQPVTYPNGNHAPPPTQPSASSASPAPAASPAHPTPSTPAQPQPPQTTKMPFLPEKLPFGIVQCAQCLRPCSGDLALQYHTRRARCGSPGYMWWGRDICKHCGSHFSGGGGRAYHEKSNVCGAYPDNVERAMTSYLEPTFGCAVRRTAVKAPEVVRSVPSSSPGDPYSFLSPENRARFDKEMQDAENFYGDLMKQAMTLPSQAERDVEISKLKNRYNTKQSNTRKKYGIRLRERRSQADIEAERSRMFGTPSKDAELDRSAKKARLDEGGRPASTQPAVTATQVESPRKRVPMHEMGGLSGSSATAELVDPTADLTPSRPTHRGPTSSQSGIANQGTSDDPMQIDDDSSGSESDIPAQLPG